MFTLIIIFKLLLMYDIKHSYSFILNIDEISRGSTSHRAPVNVILTKILCIVKKRRAVCVGHQRSGHVIVGRASVLYLLAPLLVQVFMNERTEW